MILSLLLLLNALRVWCWQLNSPSDICSEGEVLVRGLQMSSASFGILLADVCPCAPINIKRLHMSMSFFKYFDLLDK